MIEVHHVERQNVRLELDAPTAVSRPTRVNLFPIPAFIVVEVEGRKRFSLDRCVVEYVRFVTRVILGCRADITEWVV